MKALVLGYAGFIGSHLTDKILVMGHQVKDIDCFNDYYFSIKGTNLSNTLTNSDFELIEKDIISLDSFPDVDYVFHLAAQAGVRATWGKSFAAYTRNNINVTQKLLEYYKGKQIQKFIYFFRHRPMVMHSYQRKRTVFQKSFTLRRE